MMDNPLVERKYKMSIKKSIIPLLVDETLRQYNIVNLVTHIAARLSSLQISVFLNLGSILKPIFSFN